MSSTAIRKQEGAEPGRLDRCFTANGAFMASEHWTLGVGWRYMDIDYDESGQVEKQFDLAYNGPRAWFAYSW